MIYDVLYQEKMLTCHQNPQNPTSLGQDEQMATGVKNLAGFAIKIK